MENYINQIEKILEKTNWTQAQFAQEMGVTFATVNRWINGHTVPHPSQLILIKQLLHRIVGIAPLPLKEIRKILKKVKSQKDKFRNIKRILKNEEIIDEFLLELTYHSDAIEGSTLSKKETEAILFDKATVPDKTLVEHLEAANHAAVLRDILKGKKTTPITESLIKRIHEMLMNGIREDAGEYARHPRAIRGVELALPYPEDIPREMRDFCRNVNNFRGGIIKHVAVMHADFEAIHPFGDGNGRVGRLLMHLQLLQKGFPPCIISVNQKAKYYEALEFAQKDSETHLTHFTAQGVLKGYEVVERYS